MLGRPVLSPIFFSALLACLSNQSPLLAFDSEPKHIPHVDVQSIQSGFVAMSLGGSSCKMSAIEGAAAACDKLK